MPHKGQNYDKFNFCTCISMKLFGKLSFLALFVVSAGANAGEQCRESSEAAGPVAP